MTVCYTMESVYALGFAESVGVFLVNTDLLQQYQYEIPTDWEDAFQICQIFTDQEGFHLSVQMIQILDFVCIWKSSVWTRPEQKSPYQ